jgi:YD repeat-containing protein
VTTYGYDAAGNQNAVTDPRGIEALTVFDMLGQQTETIADYTDGTPTADTNQTTDYSYDGDGHVVTMTAVMPSGESNQTTGYVYGVDAATGNTIASNDILYKTEYPDLTTGDASTSSANDVSMAYDNLGETLTKTDQNGSIHSYFYDPLGRMTLDAVTTLGSGVDGSVRALSYLYDALGRPFQQTSYDSATSFASTDVINQTTDVFNGLGQLTAEYQSHTGEVSMPGTTQVQYAYSSLATGSRPTEMIYPNGNTVTYGYAGNQLDNALGRVDSLSSSNDGTIDSYSYLGRGTIVGQAFGDTVTETTTLDNFGRTAEMNYASSGSSGKVDDFQYGYDHDGNVLYKANGVDSSFSELYTYDSLNRLSTFARGTLNDGNTAITTPNGLSGSSQSWALDAVGNQTAVTTDGSVVDKTQNSQNELTGVGSSTLTYDNDGNTTTDQSGNTYTYDAWNRLIAVKNNAGTTIATYTYDAQGRRITETHGSTTTDVYFDSGGQVVEERQGGNVTKQYVWNIDYVNDLLVQDTFTAPTTFTTLFAQHDANFNITALVDTSGVVQQRFMYTPYGVQTVLNGSWAVVTDAAESVNGFQGGRNDAATELIKFGARDYDPATGTWDGRPIRRGM